MRFPRLMRRDIVWIHGCAYELFTYGKEGKLIFEHTKYPCNERNLCYKLGFLVWQVERKAVERVYRLDEQGRNYVLIYQKEDTGK